MTAVTNLEQAARKCAERCKNALNDTLCAAKTVDLFTPIILDALRGKCGQVKA